MHSCHAYYGYFLLLWYLELLVCSLGSMHMDFPIPLVALVYLHL